jgi:bacterioferritin
VSNEPSSEIATSGARGSQDIERGAVTKCHQGQPYVVLRLLNEALATQVVCVLRYRRHHFMAKGIQAPAVAAQFLAYAGEEQGHADQLAARIMQLGGIPDFDPQGLHARSYSEYVAGVNLKGMIREDLVAERVAIDSYAGMIRCIGDSDSPTRTMLEEIRATQEKHADDLASLLTTLVAKAQARMDEPMPSSGKGFRLARG